jgi:BirA family transcriptional regulator, biotin operon repressor / biotin---[acetyl-CoA-carboxylase] ligase
MDQASLETALAGVPIKQFRYFDRLGSTNDEAARWAEQGAPDLALVVADEQTAGKGRLGRKWVTPQGAALAFSLILRPEADSPLVLQRWSGLGALAVCEGLHELYALQPEIKWPNDVLLDGRKTAGVLVETIWSGEMPANLVLGIGINVAPVSVPDAELIFPATCIEQVLHRPVERLSLLRRVLERVIAWRTRLSSPEFMAAWEERLAFRGEWVRFLPGEARSEASLNSRSAKSPPAEVEGNILGLAPDGALRLRTQAGEEIVMRVGDVRLRPV